MRIEILGSAGAVTTPKPLCSCALCQKAYAQGIPNARLGPSVYIHDAGILFDTPEEIAYELNRSRITALNACFYSHWHPDHTMGRRIFECNIQYLKNGRERSHLRRTDVYIPDFVKPGMVEWIGNWQHLNTFEGWEIIKLHSIGDGQSVAVGDARVTPVKLAVGFVSGYIVEYESKRALILMDELIGWVPALEGYFDVVILPMGFFFTHPITGERLWPRQHVLCREESGFEETIDILDKLSYGRAVFSHIEEVDGHDHETLCEWIDARAHGRDWQVAYDTKCVEV